MPGKHEIVSLLLEHKADVEGKMSVGTVGAYRELTTATNLYSIKGAISTARNIIGTMTPLLTAALTVGTEDTLAVLLKGKANCSVTDGQGRTALHLVAQGADGADSNRKALLLLKAGAEVNAKDSKNQTPLHSAVSPPVKLAVLKALLSRPGYEINAQDRKGRTPLHLFLQTSSGSPQNAKPSSPTTLTLRKQAPHSIDPALLEFVLDLLLHSQANPNIVDKTGMSALKYAIEAGLTWATTKLKGGATKPLIDTPSTPVSLTQEAKLIPKVRPKSHSLRNP